LRELYNYAWKGRVRAVPVVSRELDDSMIRDLDSLAIGPDEHPRAHFA
jgi:hypothetical protein